MGTKQWKILMVATVAVAVTRANGNHWTSRKRALELGNESLGSAYQVWDLLVNRPEDFTAQCRKADMKEAKRALADLADRTNLYPADLRLRALLIDLGRAGGVPETDLARVSTIGAYWANGMRRNYPRKEQWGGMQGRAHVGTPGQRIEIMEYATVTHVIHLKPKQMGGKAKPVTEREQILYKVKADDGTCYQWVELERSHLVFRRLKDKERILLVDGKVKSHETHEGVNFTEFYANDVALRPNQ